MMGVLMQRLAFLFCLLFTLTAQAEVLDCATSLKKEPLRINQEDANKLGEAIFYGDVEKIRKLARPLLGVKNHDYKFRSRSNGMYKYETGAPSVVSEDLLMFATDLAIQIDYPKGPIKSLQTLVEMGFKVDLDDLDDEKRGSWGIICGRLADYAESAVMARQEAQQIYSALLDAGLNVNTAIYFWQDQILLARQSQR